MTKEQRLFPHQQKQIVLRNNYIVMYNLNIFFTMSTFKYHNSIFICISKLYIELYMYKTLNHFYYGQTIRIKQKHFSRKSLAA